MLRLAVPLFLLLTIATGCASRQGAVRPESGPESGSQSQAKEEAGSDPGPKALAPMPDDSAVIAIRGLEAEPFSDNAPTLRRRLFEWLLTAPNLPDFNASTLPIDELQSSAHANKEELMMQFLFGGAAWRLGAGGSRDLAAQQEAGLRSMIVAYRNMVQADPGLRDDFLDRLDELRRLGELRRYIQRKQRAE
jgi:hypothetical protein